jgi:hypothetical protein
VELVGDSYIHQYVAALDPLLKELGARGETSTLGGCPMLIGMSLKGSRLEECRSTKEAIFARLRSTNVSVILGQAWDVYSDSATITEFEFPDHPSGVERSLAQLQASLEKTIEFLATGGRRILYRRSPSENQLSNRSYEVVARPALARAPETMPDNQPRDDHEIGRGH